MRTMKKITSALLVFVMLLSMLCSCELIGGKDPAELVNEAEKVLSEQPYAMDMAIEYSSDDADMQAVIDKLGHPTIKVEVDGVDFYEEGKADPWNGVTYAKVGQTLYTERNDEGTITVTSEPCTIEEKMILAEKLGSAANIGINDFESVKAQSFNGVSVITCTEIKDAALDVLVDSLTEQLASLNAFVNIKDVTLAMQITDGRYDTILLNCNYVITVGDDVYTLNMSYASKFDYEREVLISAPVVE